MDWLKEIQTAANRIQGYVNRTSLIRSFPLSRQFQQEIWLKPELFQPTSAFKVRPAFNAMLKFKEEAQKRGVLTTSSGNYAQAVAYAAHQLGIRATIVMTDDTAPLKVEKTRQWGAEVVFCGLSFESRFEKLAELEKKSHALVLHGFDSVETIAGDGTIGLEILEDLARLDRPMDPISVLVPASGGGLISGIALAIKTLSPQSEVIGVQPEAGGAIVRSLQKGERVNVGKVHTLADALVASVPGENTFPLIQKYVDRFVTVSESSIAEALRRFANDQKLVVEPGGCVGLAALLSQAVRPQQNRVVLVLSGGNVPIENLTPSSNIPA